MENLTAHAIDVNAHATGVKVRATGVKVEGLYIIIKNKKENIFSKERIKKEIRITLASDECGRNSSFLSEKEFLF